MKNHVQRVIAAVVIVFALQSHAASAQGLLGPVTVPPVPTEILVPAGNTVFLKGSAVGTQNYICQSSATGRESTMNQWHAVIAPAAARKHSVSGPLASPCSESMR